MFKFTVMKFLILAQAYRNIWVLILCTIVNLHELITSNLCNYDTYISFSFQRPNATLCVIRGGRSLRFLSEKFIDHHFCTHQNHCSVPECSFLQAHLVGQLGQTLEQDDGIGSCRLWVDDLHYHVSVCSANNLVSCQDDHSQGSKVLSLPEVILSRYIDTEMWYDSKCLVPFLYHRCRWYMALTGMLYSFITTRVRLQSTDSLYSLRCWKYIHMLCIWITTAKNVVLITFTPHDICEMHVDMCFYSNSVQVQPWTSMQLHFVVTFQEETKSVTAMLYSVINPYIQWYLYVHPRNEFSEFIRLK